MENKILNDELRALRSKLEKDAKQSGFRIAEAQKEIQEKVFLRKQLRSEWEERDSELEGDVSELVQEISNIQGRLLQAEELIKQLESLTI